MSRVERSLGRIRTSLENQQKSASEAEVQEARSAGNGRVHGDPAPERSARSLPGVKRRREARVEAATPRRGSKVRAGRPKGRRRARALAGWKASRLALPARSVTRSRRRRARPPRTKRHLRKRMAPSLEGATETSEARLHTACAVLRSGSAVRETAHSPAHPRRVMSGMRFLVRRRE